MDENQYDLVVDTTGNSSGLAVAMHLTRPMGTLVMKSTFSHQGSIDLTPLVVKELRVVGSRCGPFVPALRLLAQEAVACKGLISATFPLDEAEAAFAYAAQPGVLKVLIRP
jgi:threonine dehydrogenase-like Zn-dependent dehydrogenase